MLGSERQLGIIEDILLPLDIGTRYDVYFTDKRIAIVCMGSTNRVDYGTLGRRSLILGVAPAVLMYADEKRKNKQIDEEQIKNLTMDQILKLSEKSCFYAYDEIEMVKLISRNKLKFIILSKECESKFSPNEEQFKQLSDLLPTIEMLKNKLSVFGINLGLNSIHEVKSTTFFCKYCGSKNDLDALFCQSCGKQIQEETTKTESLTELTCSSCGAKNKIQASFCKKCGAPTSMDHKETVYRLI